MSSQQPSSERSGDQAPRSGRADGLLTTGDMARLSSNTLRTVRFYEEAGILEPQGRSHGGHRLFGQAQLQRLLFITDMRAAGLSLDEIRQLLELKASAPDGRQAAERALAMLDAHVAALTEKIALFRRLRGELAGMHDLLQPCLQCNGDPCFPDRCGACKVMVGRTDLSPSMRVIWSVAEGPEPEDPAR